MHKDKVKDVVSFIRETENWNIILCTRSEEQSETCPHYDFLTGTCEAKGGCVYTKKRRLHENNSI